MYNTAKMSFYEDAMFSGNRAAVSPPPPPKFQFHHGRCSGMASVSLFDCRQRGVDPSLSPLKTTS